MLGISLGDCQVGSKRQGVQQEKRGKQEKGGKQKVKQEENREEDNKEMNPIERGNIKVEMDIGQMKENFTCHECGKQYTRKDHLKRHKIQHTTDSDVLSCSQCFEIVESTDKLNEHVMKEHGATSILTKSENSPTTKIRFPCNDCDRTFSLAFKLAIHIKDNHPALTEIPSNFQHDTLDLEKSYACVNCPETFQSSKQRYKHNSSLHSGVTIPCDECEKQFSRKDKLSTHKKNKHSK